jgi:hypothetical protein
MIEKSDSTSFALATIAILGQAPGTGSYQTKSQPIDFIGNAFGSLLRDSAAPPAVWGLLIE